MKSPVRSVHTIHAKFVTEKLREVNQDCVQTVQSKNNQKKQKAQATVDLLVNDSQSGKSFSECYDRGEVIGEGGFALVYRCKHKTNGSYYAVKEAIHYLYEEEGANSLKDEVAALKLLRDNLFVITRLHDVFVDTDRTFLVMEEMRGGDLLERILQKESYSEQCAKKVARSLLEAISFCHKKKIAHRDIKPENILLADADDDATIKLCDFGCARTVTGPHSLQTMAGSPEYAAPEVYEHSETGGYGEQCDLWSAGVVIYVMLGGYCPFEGSARDVARMICDGDWVFHEKYWKNTSESPKELIRSLLTVEVEKRFTAQQALACNWLQRLELQRSNSDKDVAKNAKKPYNDLLSQSCGNWDLELTPIPMAWIPESPRVLKVKRERPVALRRFAKPKLGDNLARMRLGDSLSSLVISENSITDMGFADESENSHQTHQSFKLHCSIPDLDTD